MRNRLLSLALVALMLAVLAAVPAEARDRGRRFDDRRARVVVVDRSPRVVVVRDRFDGRPYGWNRGRKVGWGNCDLPPGLAKKYGCSDRVIILRERPVYRRPVLFFSF